MQSNTSFKFMIYTMHFQFMRPNTRTSIRFNSKYFIELDHVPLCTVIFRNDLLTITFCYYVIIDNFYIVYVDT